MRASPVYYWIRRDTIAGSRQLAVFVQDVMVVHRYLLRTKWDVVLGYGSTMTQTERLALLALAPGVYLRADAHCPKCHRKLNPVPQWLVQGAVIDWVYECDCCLTTWDSGMKSRATPRCSF